MPIKPLSRNIVARLRILVIRANKRGKGYRVDRALGRMRNIDHRRNETQPASHDSTDVGYYGKRIREMDISNNDPEGLGLVIKRTHSIDGTTAVEELDIIARRIKNHNKTFQNRDNELFDLHEPYAYAIGRNLIAMTKTDYPSIGEVIGSPGKSDRTTRGTEFFQQLIKSHPAKELITIKKLTMASEILKNRIRMEPGNVLITGFNNSKFQFTPLPDLK